MSSVNGDRLSLASLRSQEYATTSGLWFSYSKFELLLPVKKSLDKEVRWLISSIIFTYEKYKFSILKETVSTLQKSILSSLVFLPD